MTILTILLVLSACASVLLSRVCGLCAIWWLILRALLFFIGAFVALTLLFFLYSQEDIPGEERLRRYVDEANRMMSACGMGDLYPVHPYEAFLLICTLSDCPLAVYVEVWELSYESSRE